MKGSVTLIYDGECAFCRRWVERLQRWDRQGRIRYLPLQDYEAAVSHIPRPALEAAMHLVRTDGRTFAGAAATPELLRVLPWGWALRWLFWVPGVLRIAHRVYRWVAKRRHRFGCGSAVCQRG